MIRVDHDHLHNADLDRPLLVVKIRDDGVTDLPVMVLDEQQEYQVRIWDGDKGLPYHH